MESVVRLVRKVRSVVQREPRWTAHVVGIGRPYSVIELTGRLEGERITVPPESTLTFRGANCSRLDLSSQTIPNFVAFGSTFDHCDSTATVFEGGVLGDLPLVVYRDCVFDGADLRWVGAQFARFERCSFAKARLDDWRVSGAEFIDCRFSGRLFRVIFSGKPVLVERLKGIRARNDFHGNDFRDADLDDCDFRHGIDLDANLWPEDGKYVILRDALRKVALARTHLHTIPEQEAVQAARLFQAMGIGYEDQRDLLIRRDQFGPAVWKLLGVDG